MKSYFQRIGGHSTPAHITMLASGSTLAQTQLVKPPIAQYWMDVATMSMASNRISCPSWL